MCLHGDELIEKAERISSRVDFCRFAREFAENLEQKPSEWKNVSLNDFVRGLAGFAEDMDGYYANTGSNIDCDIASWRVFAEMLLAARVYE